LANFSSSCAFRFYGQDLRKYLRLIAWSLMDAWKLMGVLKLLPGGCSGAASCLVAPGAAGSAEPLLAA